MTHAQQIDAALEQLPETASFALPVFFIGREGVRHIGDAQDYDGVDALLIARGLSAQKISKAQQRPRGRYFYIAHA